MGLTKEKAVEEHRKMWIWIANRLEDMADKADIILGMTVEKLKIEYCKIYDFNIYNHCFCCDYALHESTVYPNCKKCPLSWGNEEKAIGYFYCEKWTEVYGYGLWWQAEMLSRGGAYAEAALIARKIANLPEKK